jgi:hypothetical protein
MTDYYYLKKGELIQEGDEVDVSNGWNDPAEWRLALSVGDTAPDPAYPAHRQYRRRITHNAHAID